MKFIEARSQEIDFFQKVLNEKKRFKNNLPGQQVPKHMRRRAMSHNRKRIPSRIKKIEKQPASNHKEKKKYYPRKTARKRLFKSNTNLLLLWKFNQSNEAKIMETHRFQSKRLFMHPYGGVKIASKSRSKCFRTAYRFSQTHCVLRD